MAVSVIVGLLAVGLIGENDPIFDIPSRTREILLERRKRGGAVVVHGVRSKGMMDAVRSPTDPTDARVVLTELFEEHFDSVFAFCVLRCGSRPLAEEIASDVFADAVRTLRADATTVLTHGWLVAVARRRLIDHWRRTERDRRRIERISLLRPAESAGTDEVDDEAVMAALDSLSDRQRLALVLRYVDELSVSEVADALAMTYRATESLLARARRSFSRSYDETRRMTEEAP